MGNRPGSVHEELVVDLPLPRDRRDTALGDLKAAALTSLHLAHVI